MKILLIDKIEIPLRGNLLVPLFKSTDLEKNLFFQNLASPNKNHLKKVCRQIKWTEKEARVVFLLSNPKTKIIFIGLGEKEKWQKRKFILTARRIISLLKSSQIDSVSLSLNDFLVEGTKKEELLSLMVQNFLMADFEFTNYKEKPEGGWPQIGKIQIFSRDVKNLSETLREGVLIGEEVNGCRKLANTPGGIMTPKRLAEETRNLMRGIRVEVKILGLKEILRLKMGGIAGVSRGSKEEPRFIILNYGPKIEKPLVLIGKGVTFDTGGLNIKTGD